MGISRGGARFLLEEARNLPFSGAVLQLGRQHLFFTQENLDGWAALHSVQLDKNIPPENVRQPLLDPSFLDDGSFFSELGFSVVESMDYSDFEQATHIHDLNKPIPRELAGRYDTIYDGGTIEHVFDVRSSLTNIFEMLKVGGRIIHSSPSSNHVDHGFYMFSPTLFYDWYMTNGFIVHECQIFLYTKDFDTMPWRVYDYEPGCLDGLSFGGFNSGHLVGIYISAEKTDDSTCNIIPQQGMYVSRWESGSGAKGKRLHRPRQDKTIVRDRRTFMERVLRQKRRLRIPNKVAEY
ncbi:hypothetical protein [Labrys neptuniae]